MFRSRLFRSRLLYTSTNSIVPVVASITTTTNNNNNNISNNKNNNGNISNNNNNISNSDLHNSNNNSNNNNNDDSKINNKIISFLNWCKNNNIYTNDITLKSSFINNKPIGLGVYANKNIKSGEILSIIPYTIILSRSFINNKKLIALTDPLYTYNIPPLIPLTHEEILKEPDPLLSTYANILQLSCILFIELYGNNNKYNDYINLLPDINNPPLNSLYLNSDLIISNISNSYGDDFNAYNAEKIISECNDTCVEYREFINEIMSSNPVIVPMLERIAKSKFNNDINKTRNAFSYVISLVETRAASFVTDDYKSLSEGKITPYMHISPEVKKKFDDFYNSKEFLGEDYKPNSKTVAKVVKKPIANAKADVDIDMALKLSAPFIAPLFDFINHGDSDANCDFTYAPLGPYNGKQMKELERAMSPVVPAEVMEKWKKSPSLIAENMFVFATKDIAEGEEIVREYASQLEYSKDMFLTNYGFVPKSWSDERRLRELKMIEESNEKEEARSKFFKRMEKARAKEEEKYLESLPPKGIFNSDPSLSIKHIKPIAVPKSDDIMDELGIGDLIDSNPTRTKITSDWDIEIASDKPWANHTPSAKMVTSETKSTETYGPDDKWFDKLIDEITTPKKPIPWYEDTLENNCPSRRRKVLRMPKSNHKKL